MFTLKRLKIRGFRAYTEYQEFIFDNPMTILFGENHRGKSSTLNAIEWCLFGNECIGAKSGIRERIDWEIPNRNLGSSPNVSVELELEDENKGIYTILRRWISKTKDELKVTLPDGKSLEGQEAKEKLAWFLKASFRDFLTTAYQHQEAIRAILTQEPRERNDAIDRLLGLSDYRNILTGIEATKLSTKQKKMGDDFDSFSREIYVALHTRESDLKDMREEAIQKGVREDRLSEKGALEIANKVKDQLPDFALKAGLTPADIKVPEQFKDLSPFLRIADEEIKRFRTEMPGVKKQQDLYELRAKIIELQTKYEQTMKGLDDFRDEQKNFVKQNGDGESINKRKVYIENEIKKRNIEMSEANAKAAAIRNAINFLKLEKLNKDICPVCGKKTPDLLGHLEKEWEEKFEKQVGKIKKQIEELETKSKDIEYLYTKWKRIKEGIENQNKEVGVINKEIGKALSREITAKDDPHTILDNELEKIKKELEKLEQTVKSKQKTLDEIVFFLKQIQVILNILNLDEKKRIVEQIQQSCEYQRMEELKDHMAVLIDDVEKIKQAISEASYEEAQQKVSEAGKAIDNYFRRITNNPSVKKLEFLVNVDSRTALNSYEFKNQLQRDLTPILSQGDLNAMALSIFLGMACSEGTNQLFDFVILDDPSQSLGSEHKENLVVVLDEVLRKRIVILSSMDKELHDLIFSKVTKAKTKYVFSEWSPEHGPIVKNE
jgi:DNA repair exonuclease SbcCD ATPase subunit